MKRYYFIVGEASGDLHAANLIKELSKLDHKALFKGFGGDRMQKEGFKLTKHYREMAFMGFWEVIKNLSAISKNFKQAKKELDKYVLDLKESLKLYKKVFIEEVGTLLYTSEGNILFVQSNSRNHLLDSFGLSTVQYPAIQRTSVQEQFEEKIKHIDKKHLTSNKKVWLKAAAVLLPLFMVSALGISNKEKIQTTYANLSPFSSSTTEIVETKKSYSLDKFDIESPTNDIEQAVISFYEAKDNMVTTPIDLDKHFIIAGAFSSEKNAQKMIAKLKGANFGNSKIVNQSRSGLYRVCYDGFSNSSEALSALRKIKKTNPSAWLLSLN